MMPWTPTAPDSACRLQIRALPLQPAKARPKASGCAPPFAAANPFQFRSCFDSSQTRQTVRQGRFQGLLFAPVFAVMQSFMRPRNGFEPAPKPHRGGAACARPCLCTPNARKSWRLFRTEPRLCPPLPAFARPAPARPALRNHRWFRYRFESIQARKTVRWRRFWGLLFAPVFAVMRGFTRLRAGFEPAPKPHRSGAACARPCLCAPSARKPWRLFRTEPAFAHLCPSLPVFARLCLHLSAFAHPAPARPALRNHR